VDTKVGDILANIRRSVDDDMDTLALPSTASHSSGTLMRGVLREMRVSMTAEPNSTPSVREEIESLRERIKRKGEAASLLSAPSSAVTERLNPPSLTEPDARGEFSGILSGRAPERAAPVHSRPQPAPILRPSIADEDHFSGDYQEQGQPEYHEDYQERSYGATPQHYHDRVDHSYPMLPQQPIMSQHAEAATETAFRHLSETLLARATGDRGIEDMTRELLRGMIKQWLDTNLPTLVEELVREEIERVARRGR
jgi:cell pole-organizing protein PopZ